MRLNCTHLVARLKPPDRRRSSAGLVAFAIFVIIVITLKIVPPPATSITMDARAYGSQLVTITQPAPKPTEIVTFDQGCLTAECHFSYEVSQVVHAPVQERDCAACHDKDRGGHTYPLLESADALCADCHNTGHTGGIRHEVLDNEGCLACHDAHASQAEFLLVRSTVQETCEQCHPTHEGNSQHQPYEQGRCGACHEPHESDYTGLLRGGRGSDHCATCHEQVSTITESSIYTHNVVEGGCTACHAAHATDESPLLTSPLEKQCISCHQDVGQAMGLSVTHDAVLEDDKCLSCHDPHGSDRTKMLREDQASLCLQCHNKPVTATDGRTIPDMTPSVTAEAFKHGPITAGNCSACHSVHGSEHARLLRQPAIVALRDSFDVTNYALCFSCHDQQLVLSAATTSSTQFRDGDRNLHAVHIQGENGGRTCTSCHAVHANDQPRHIAKSIAYQGSDWLMPIEFKLTLDGGRCAPGCHEPLAYARTKALQPGDSTGGVP